MKFANWFVGRHWTARVLIPIVLGVMCGSVVYSMGRDRSGKAFASNVAVGVLTIAVVNEYNLARWKRREKRDHQIP